MKKSSFFVLFFLSCLSFLFVTKTANADTIIAPTSISSNTVWSNVNTYVVNTSTTVQPGITLTVEPGTVIKFNAYAYMVIKGTLQASGSDQSNIVFTSYKDDAYGGDTNGDGSATVPVRGDWYHLESYTGGTINMSYSRVRYGGRSFAMVNSSGGTINMDHCYVEQSLDKGIETRGTARITNNQLSSFYTTGIYINNGSPEISGNTATGGNYGVYILNGTPNVHSNTISNSSSTGIYVSNGSPTIMGNILNGGSGYNRGIVVANGTATIENNNISQFPNYEAIMLGSSGGSVSGSVYGNNISNCKFPLGFTGSNIPSITLDANSISNCTLNGINLNLSLPSCTVPSYSLPYIVTYLTVGSGITVDISPGAIFKIPYPSSISIYGTANVIGNNEHPIVFTSVKDDTYGGDTNNDGTATTPQPGDWIQISVAQNGILNITSAILRYGMIGIYAPAQTTGIYVYNCDISRMSHYGIQMTNSGKGIIVGNKIHHNGNSVGNGIDLGSGASPLIIGNEIYSNKKGISILGSSSAIISGNSFHHNNTGIQLMMQSGDQNNCNISYNNFENNVYYGFDNWYANYPPVAIVENNWWGSASGPRPIGTGDAINSTTLVDVRPWLKARYVLPEPTSLLGNRFWDCKGNDPVNTVTGNFTYEKKDIEIHTRGIPLSFSRFYNSLDNRLGPLGRGWQHNYNCSVTVNGDNSATVLYPDGHQITFQYDNGSYIRPLACFETLTRTASGFLLTFKDQTVYEFDASGLLAAIRDKNNNTNSLLYSGTLLQSVTDPAGRALQFQYWPDNKLKQVTDPAGRALSLSYDENGNHTACIDVNGGLWNYGYTAGLLTSIIDPDNHHIVTNTFDANGRVISQSDGENHSTTFTYDPNNRINTMTDALQNVATFRYDPQYRVTSISYPGGVQESFVYDYNNNRISDNDKNGKNTSYTYDDMGNMLTKTDPAPLSYITTYTYNSFNNPTRLVDAAGYITDYTYEPSGNLHTVSRAVYGGTATTTFTYNNYGQVSGITNANGKTTTIGYDQYGNQSSVIDPLGHTTTYTYDIIGRRLTATDPRGNLPGADPALFTWTNTYDAGENLLTVTDPLGNTTTNTYDLNNKRTSTTDPRNNTITFAYDRNDRLIAESGPLGHMISYGYDGNGNRTSVNDAVYHTTTYGYDYLGRLTSVTDPADKTESYTLDGNGNVLVKTDRRGHSTSYEYDVLNRLTKVTDAFNNTVLTGYDALGNTISVTDQRNNTTQFVYDQGSRLLSVINPLSKATSYTYDLVGNRLSVTDPRGAIWTYTYDDANRQIGITDPLSHISRTEYDSVGNAVYGTDANNISTGFAYDALNRLTSVTNALGHTTSYTYDNNGNLTAATNARSKVSTFEYDALNRLTREADPLGSATRLEYDAAGRLTSRTKPDNQAISYSYDTNSRLTGITYPGGSGVTYTYDENGNRTLMNDPAGATSYIYDKLNRLTSVTRDSDTTGYGYDPAGNITGITYPGGLQIGYTYSAINQPVSVTDAVYSANISYDEAGNRIKEYLPNGIVVDYTYDPNGRLTALRHAQGENVIAGVVYTLDNVGNRLSAADEQGRTTNYTYDNLYQLTRVEYPGEQTIEYNYDPAGNRISQNGISYLYDDANRLIQAGTMPYGYDTNGNLLSVGEAVYYRYDFENRLVSYTDATKTVNYTYDGDGIRNGQSVSGSVYGNDIEYIYDFNAGLPRLLVEKDDSGKENNYIYAGRVFSRIGPEGQVFYHQDGLGSISVVSDVYGSPLNWYTYDAFGSPRSVTESVYNPLMFTGEPYDSSGLIYLRARYYDPTTGRFLTPDTYPGKLRDPMSRNKYVYCGNNPVLYVDPSGNIKICQFDDLALGLWDSGVESVQAILSTPGAFWELCEAIWSGSLSFDDLVQALGDAGDDIIEPLKHVAGNSGWIWLGDPTDTDVHEYGRNLGHSLQSIGGATAAVKLLAKSSPKVANVLQKLIHDQEGHVRLDGWSGNINRFDPDQQALVELAKDAKNKGGVTLEESEIIMDWANEYNLPGSHGPEIHPNRPGPASNVQHIHVGPVGHIPIY